MICRWWRRQLRNLDRRFYFPAIRRAQLSVEEGDKAIAYHVNTDRAWRFIEERKDEPIEWGRR